MMNQHQPVTLFGGLADRGLLQPREYSACGHYAELYFSAGSLLSLAAFEEARFSVVERMGERAAAIMDDAAIRGRLRETDGNLRVLRGALDALWHYFDEINQNKLVEYIDNLIVEYRVLFSEQHGWNSPNDEPHIENLVWINLALFAFSLDNLADQHAKVGQHARRGAAAGREEYAARALLPEDQGRNYQSLETLCDEIIRQDRRGVAAEQSAISLRFIATGVVSRLGKAGIPDYFLCSTGPHRPRAVALSRAIAESW